MKLLVFLVVFAAFASVQGSWRPITKRQIPLTVCTTEEALAMVPTNCRDDFEDFISGRVSEYTEAELTELYCDSGCFRPIVEVITRCTGGDESNAEELLGYYENGFCNSNENGESCSALLSGSRVREEWDSIQSNCLTGDLSLPNPLVCMENCASALTNSVTDVGCCINIFNFTVPDGDYVDTSYNNTNYRLWAACDVQVPGFCSGATAAHFSVLLASIMVLIATSLAY